MTLAYDMVVAGVIATISVLIHVISLHLFAPNTVLYQMAADSTHFIGQNGSRLDFWYQCLVMWVPMGGLVVAGAWPIVRAYRRQAVTARQPIQ